MAPKPLTLEQIKQMFPNATESLLAANLGVASERQVGATGSEGAKGSTGAHTAPEGKARRAKEPNQTERDFAEWRLKAQEPMFEAITLRWAGMTYTPDWVVFTNEGVECYEVKGPKIWDGSVEKFKAFRAAFPAFSFEMWQRASRRDIFRRIH